MRSVSFLAITALLAAFAGEVCTEPCHDVAIVLTEHKTAGPPCHAKERPAPPEHASDSCAHCEQVSSAVPVAAALVVQLEISEAGRPIEVSRVSAFDRVLVTHVRKNLPAPDILLLHSTLLI